MASRKGIKYSRRKTTEDSGNGEVVDRVDCDYVLSTDHAEELLRLIVALGDATRDAEVSQPMQLGDAMRMVVKARGELEEWTRGMYKLARPRVPPRAVGYCPVDPAPVWS